MNYLEKLAYVIIAAILFNMALNIYTSDWNAVMICICAFVGWFEVASYKREERKRRERDNDQFTV